jgi:hypothetical protein
MFIINNYVCERCKGIIITIQRVEGTTPFGLLCRADEQCLGIMRSQLGRYLKMDTSPMYEWFRPAPEELKDPLEIEHLNKGGLFLRKLMKSNKHGRKGGLDAKNS